MSTSFELCILRLSAIGDVCHAAAMVNAITKHKPDIKITWVIGKIEYQLLKDLPNVEFVIYDKSAGKQAKQAVKDALKGRVFDALFVMQVALRAGLLSRVIKAKRRIGFDYKRSKEGHSLFINERIAPRKHAHVLEGFMGFAEALGVPALDKPQWQIPISEDDHTFVTQTLGNTRYAVISPTASKAERNWLPERYAQIADYLVAQNLEVVLCGGPGALDKDTANAITQHTNNIHYNLVGKTTLKQMLAVLKGAQLVIAPDTGPAHMATTQGTPVLGLYAHSNPRRTGPYLSLHTTASAYEQAVQRQHGKTWQQLPWGTRVKGKDLMTEISVQEVKSLVQKILHHS
jgi:heptosyltransferase I